jgi:hypothetical protein
VKYAVSGGRIKRLFYYNNDCIVCTSSTLVGRNIKLQLPTINTVVLSDLPW